MPLGHALQVGEFDIVLEHGNRALEKWEARSMRRDILFAMSLAHLGLASEALEAKDKVSFKQTQAQNSQDELSWHCCKPAYQDHL